MKTIRDKILVLAHDKNKTMIEEAALAFVHLDILEAGSENKAFELIYNHALVLVIIDETLGHIDSYKIGSMLLSHRHTHNTPLLILCEKVRPDNFLSDFELLNIDHLLLPCTGEQIEAKIRLFLDLYKKNSAVFQSIDEQDRVYKKILDQHEQTASKEAADKALSVKASHATNRIRQALRIHASNIHLILRNHNLNAEERTRLAAVKNAAEQISLTTKKLTSHIRFAKEAAVDRTYRILYVQGSDDDFSIFHHIMKSTAKCELIQARHIAHSLEQIGKDRFDLIFTDYTQADGNGLELLARLNRIRSDVPVIFILDRSHAHIGPDAVLKGAFTFMLKEELSGTQLLSLIRNTLDKAALTREVEDAQSRIVMFSRKDYLTRLYNRRCFEQELETEMSKAKRYKTALSILLLDFDRFHTINETHGFDIGDQILSASAGIIQGMVRANDVVCRYGGEEFGIILSSTAITGARMLAERIRRALASHDFYTDTGSLNLTVSIGIAAFDHESDTTLSGFVKKGLSALENAMEVGGNKVTLFIDNTP